MKDLKTRLKEYEGTKEYQAKLGYFRDGKFHRYKDSLNYWTIGYGHLITANESYTVISELEAESLLSKDIATARMQVAALQIEVPDDWEDLLIIMVFQLGLTGTQKFKGMLKALRDKNYPLAVCHAKDSLWYRQTPNRVDAMIRELRNK